MRELEVRLVRHFLREHPLEAARALEKISAEERAALLADEPPERAAAGSARTRSGCSAEALRTMELRAATALICRLPAGTAAQRLMRLASSAQEAMLHAVPEPWRKPLGGGAVVLRHGRTMLERTLTPADCVTRERLDKAVAPPQNGRRGVTTETGPSTARRNSLHDCSANHRIRDIVDLGGMLALRSDALLDAYRRS